MAFSVPECIILGIEPAYSTWESTGLWLLLLHPEQKPPHLAMVCDGAYFSLTNAGVQLGESAAKIIAAADRKKLPLLAIRLQSQEPAKALALLQTCFGAYEKAGKNGTTCLYPIRDFVENSWPIPARKASYVFELVPMMQAAGAVSQSVQSHLEQWLAGSTFKLLQYTQQEIQQRIESLNKSTVPC